METNGFDVVNIAICDDEPVMRKKLHHVIHNIVKEQDIPFELDAFESGQDLLRQDMRFQLIFLDIDMPELDGIQTGIQLRKKDENCEIVIASEREDRFKETYQIQALRFISKPYDEEETREAIQAYWNKFLIGVKQIELFRNRNSMRVCQRDIQYISACDGGA